MGGYRCLPTGKWQSRDVTILECGAACADLAHRDDAKSAKGTGIEKNDRGSSRLPRLLTYQQLSGRRSGLLVNGNVALIKDGIQRMVKKS